MKKKVLIAASLLTLSMGAFAFMGLNTNKETIQTSAVSSKELYVQVKDISEINVGDTVLIASGEHAVAGMGGNPCFTYADTVNGGNNDRTKFYFDSTSVIKLLVGQGYNGSDSYSFKSLRTASEESSYWLKTNNRYLSYADKITIDGHDYGYHNDGITIQTKGDIIFKNDLMNIPVGILTLIAMVLFI